ncbi:MAG: DUF4386 domain-containing protein [Anaerolineales bacterium]|nr:DUF4386 domain-containing protein [Anaerolineales bacterium]
MTIKGSLQATEKSTMMRQASSRSKVNAYRKTAVIVGVLFIIGTVAGIFSGVLTVPILDVSDYLSEVAANESQLVWGALMVLVMGFPLAMIPVIMFPIFRKYNEPLALGAVVFRGVLEAVTYILMVICWLALIPLSQEFVKAGAQDAAYLQTLGDVLTDGVYWINHILALVFTIGAAMLYWLFWKTKLIPSWLALWGLIGAILYFAAPIANMLDPQHLPLSLGVKWGYLMIPLAIQEMVFALWLIIKGFNRVAVVSE